MSDIWLGFDVDETLGCFNYLFPILDFLLLQENTPYEPTQRTLQYFVRNISQNETTPGKKSGLFRPGLYTFFANNIKGLLDAGKIKAMVMYSNNGSYPILHFCAMVIDHWMEQSEPSFCNLIHRTHPIRREANGRITTLAKNWRILTSAFVEGNCPAPVLGQTFFYDDSNEHQPLIQRMGPNYIRVTPYFGPAYPGNILISLRNAFLEANVLVRRKTSTNKVESGNDYVFTKEYITRLYETYKLSTNRQPFKHDLQKLFDLTGTSESELANVTWKVYQYVMLQLFKDQDISMAKYKHLHVKNTKVDLDQWYAPLIVPHHPVSTTSENANTTMQRMIKNRSRGTENSKRSSSNKTAKRTSQTYVGRSLVNMATSENTPMSMENEMKAAFGLGGGYGQYHNSKRRQTRKNPSRKKKHSK